VRQRLLTSENRKWWTLAAVSLALFMIMLDNTVVNVALPSIQRDLGAQLSELEWIVSGYALTFASLLLTGGKLGDLLGRRRILVIGMVIFGGSSLACAVAPSAGVLIGARVVQGVGAALMSPATLSILTATFAPRQRGTAIGIWVGVSATALAIGPLVGGLLTEHAGWSSIFYVNVPIAAVAVVASFLLIDESKDMSHEQRLDLPGLVTSGVGLFALTYGLIEANTYGWTSGRIVGAFAIAAVSQVLAREWLATLADWVYIWGFWPVLVAAAIFLYARHRDEYVLLRNAVFISGLIGFFFFALLPVAPPRLADPSVVDTIREHTTWYRTMQPIKLTNQYAAMPSLHVGWSVLVGIVAARAIRHPAAYAFAVLMPTAMALAVVVTANHYVADVLVGGAVASTALMIALRLGSLSAARRPARRVPASKASPA
jgi:MFS family permease